MAPINKRTERARENHTLAILSRKPFFVARQTPRAPDASHSLKAAKILSRCPYTRQGLKALLGAPRHLSELISVAYTWQPQKPAKIKPYKEFLYNWPPSTFLLSLASLATIAHNRPPIDSPILRLTIREINIKKILNLNIKKILSVNIKKILNLNIKKILNLNIKKILSVNIKKILSVNIKKILSVNIKKKLKYKH
jgi:hypothetical protein